MKVANFLTKELLGREVFAFFLLATFVYVIPLILVDYYYIDDNWRSLEAGTAWAGQGRLFAELLYNALTFTSGAPNIFPLPLLIAVVFMALALTRLTLHYYKQPTVSGCLVLLPLWYNPFFLQNLSYQYDGSVMTLSLVAVIYAIIFRAKSAVLQIVLPGLLIAIAVGLYQISINVFLGLVCIELVRVASDSVPWKSGCSLLGVKFAQLVVGGVVYYVTAYQSIIPERLPLQEWSVNGLARISENIGLVASKAVLLFHGTNRWLMWAVLFCAAAGAVQVGIALYKRKDSVLHRVVLAVVCLLTLPVLLLLVSGAALLFRDFNEGARTLMGFAVLLVLLFYLSHRWLEAVQPRAGLLLAIPLLSMLSLSYAYGRVLNVQKEFATSALFSLGHDIASHPQLREAKRIYLSISYSNHWLSGATGSFELMPVLAYILNVDFFVLAENLPRVGITNVVPEKERRNATLAGYLRYTPVVDSKFYSIYLIGDYGFIVMKEVPSSGEDKW